jgi:hypothetical protein
LQNLDPKVERIELLLTGSRKNKAGLEYKTLRSSLDKAELDESTIRKRRERRAFLIMEAASASATIPY